MDLKALPDEMISSIMKYCNYASIYNIRKTNTRMDNIAKAYDIGTKLHIMSISLDSSHKTSEESEDIEVYTDRFECTIEFDCDTARCIWFPNEKEENKFKKIYRSSEGNHLNIIDGLLQKVELRGAFNIAHFCYPIDDHLLTVFEKNQKSLRTMTAFLLKETEIACSSFSVKQFLLGAKMLREYLIGPCVSNLEVFIQPEVLATRKWRNLYFWGTDDYSFEHPALNDEFLLSVVKNCNECSIDFSKVSSTSFTVDGIIKLIKTLVEEGVKPEYLDLQHVDGLGFYYEEERLWEMDADVKCYISPLSFVFGEGDRKIRKKIVQGLDDCSHRKVYFVLRGNDNGVQQEFQDFIGSSRKELKRVGFPPTAESPSLEFMMCQETDDEDDYDTDDYDHDYDRY